MDGVAADALQDRRTPAAAGRRSRRPAGNSTGPRRARAATLTPRHDVARHGQHENDAALRWNTKPVERRGPAVRCLPNTEASFSTAASGAGAGQTSRSSGLCHFSDSGDSNECTAAGPQLLLRLCEQHLHEATFKQACQIRLPTSDFRLPSIGEADSSNNRGRTTERYGSAFRVPIGAPHLPTSVCVCLLVSLGGGREDNHIALGIRPSDFRRPTIVGYMFSRW